MTAVTLWSEQGLSRQANTAAAREELSVPDDIDDAVITGLLHFVLGKDADATAAFAHRADQPEQWLRVWERTLKSLKKLIKKIDDVGKRRSNDCLRAEAVVRNVSTEPPKADLPDSATAVYEMNPQQFAAYLKRAAQGSR